jgi:hypothetical protein
MSQTGKLILAGTHYSCSCLYTVSDHVSRLRSDPLFVAKAMSSGAVLLQDKATGCSIRIKLRNCDRRGNAEFDWA